MSQKIYLNILRIGCYIALLSVFLVFKNLLFPFITSKQIFFNLLIEFLFVFWVVLIVKYPEYRPKKNYITFGLLAFFAAITLSLVVSVDVNLSMWGDIERMLGIFHVLHFFAFYLVIITVFRRWQDWKIFFIVSVVFAIGESIKSLTGNPYGTIGNTAYVSGYLIFNMYFCLILFFREEYVWLRWLYLAPIILMLFAFKAADTTGALVGLGTSVMFIFLAYGIFTHNRRLRIITLAIFAFLTVSGVILYTNKDKAFVNSNPVLNSVTGVSFKSATFQTRLISWRAAAKDFKNHPLLGVGWGNYALIFDKYFQPNFFNYTESETYFDRAHNNLIDIGSTTGLIGLLAYLSIFGALAFYLIKGYRNDKFSLHEFVLISSLIAAYFVQNLAVFDSLVTYVGLMMTLGYIYWLYHLQGEEAAGDDAPLVNREVYAFVGIGIIMAVIMYQYNIKVYKMLDLTIQGQIYNSQGDVNGVISAYRKALSYNTVLDRDSRTSLNRVVASNPDILSKLDEKTRQDILDYNLELAKKNVDYNPQDSLNEMLYAQLLNITASFNSSSPDKFSYYSDRALEAINQSIGSSPGRIPVYFQKAQIYITRGQKDEAIATLEYAANLNLDYREGPCYLSRTLFFYKDEAKAYEYMDRCLDDNGAYLLSPTGLVQGLINHYLDIKDWPRVIKLYEQLTQLEPKNIKYLTALAKLYADQGDKEMAKKTAERAIEVDPSIKQYADDFIKSLGL